MLYTVLVLLTGVYLGQEYPGLPSVRQSLSSLAVYFTVQPQNHQVEQISWLRSVIETFLTNRLGGG